LPRIANTIKHNLKRTVEVQCVRFVDVLIYLSDGLNDRKYFECFALLEGIILMNWSNATRLNFN